MNLEEIQKIHPYLQETIEVLKGKLGEDEAVKVFSVSAKIQTTRGDKKATWIIVLDRFGNTTVTRS